MHSSSDTASLPWRQRWGSLTVPCLIVVLGVMLALWAHDRVRDYERRRTTLRFRQLVADDIRALDAVRWRHEEVLLTLRTVFTASEAVTREEFRRIAHDLLSRAPEMTALEWVPRVPAAARGVYEQRARGEGLRDFEFLDRAPQGTNQLGRAGDWDEYWPVYYIEPLASNERALGYNLRTAPTVRELEAARDTGKPHLSGRIRLIQETGEDWSVVVIVPVYNHRLPRGSVAERRLAHLGFLQGVFRLRQMMDSTLRERGAQGYDLLVQDASAAAGDRLVFYRPAPGSPAIPPPVTYDGEFTYNERFEVFQRVWSFSAQAGPGLIRESATGLPLLVLGTGMVFSVLVGTLAGLRLQRTRVVEARVKARTLELRQLNDRLQQEITERRGVEQQLEREHGLLRTLIDSLPDNIYVKDTQGRYLLTNEANRKLLALPSVEAALGRTVFDLLPERVARGYDEDDRRVLKEGAVIENREEPYETHDGKRGWFLTSKLPLRDREGRITGLVGISRDFTERKRLEADREAMDRHLSESQKRESLGTLAGGVAHDFNNILTVILNHATVARLETDNPAAVKDSLLQIEHAAARAGRLCNQMLAYSGRGQFVVEPIDLSALVEDTLPLLRVSISHKAELVVNAAPDLPAVLMDVNQIRQIILNLVLNASDALGDKAGVIRITTELVQAGPALLSDEYGMPELQPGEYVALQVSDTGCGMDDATKARIFEPFFSTKFTGRGLGLAAVLGIVRGHKGAIRVESRPGQGSTFRLLLPAARGVAPHPLDREIRPAVSEAGSRVLVVDDEPAITKVVCRALTKAGFEAVAAASGAQALEEYAANPAAYVAVLLDLTMPQMDGEQTFNGLRKLNPEVRVLLMSGYSEHEATARFAGRGLAGFIQKPFQLGALVGQLKSVIGAPSR